MKNLNLNKNVLKILSLIFTSGLFILWLIYLPQFPIPAIILTSIPVLGSFIGNIIHSKRTWNK